VNRNTFLIMLHSCLLVMVFSVPEKSAAAEVIFDRSSDSLKRGAVTFVNLCMLCHEMKYLRYQNLLEVGFSHNEVDALRKDKNIQDPLQSSTAPEVAKLLFGMRPPELSLMAKARKNGPSYIYNLLTSYYETADGVIQNQVFPGISMPDVLSYSIETDPLVRERLEQKAREVAVFMEWAADPNANQRRNMGYYVMAYLFILTFLLYLMKRKVWRRLK